MNNYKNYLLKKDHWPFDKYHLIDFNVYNFQTKVYEDKSLLRIIYSIEGGVHLSKNKDYWLDLETNELTIISPNIDFDLNVPDESECLVMSIPNQLVQSCFEFGMLDLSNISWAKSYYHYSLDDRPFNITFLVKDDYFISNFLNMVIQTDNLDSFSQKVSIVYLLLQLSNDFLIEIEKSKTNIYFKDMSDLVIEYIEQNLMDISLESLANHFNYHPNYLSKMITERTGISFQQHVLIKRMEKAKQLLIESNLDIEDISNKVGYGTLSNFYKAFKKYYKMTPGKYRKKYSKKYNFT